MKRTITDAVTLQKCREILDRWSASQAYSPTKVLGADSEFVSAESHTVERFTLTTVFRARWYTLERMKNGSSYNNSPVEVSAYDIWDDIKADVKDQDVEEPLRDTTFAKVCHDCGGEGKTVCNACHGRGEVKCDKRHLSFYVNGKHYTNMVRVGCGLVFSTKVTYNGEEYYKCDCDETTHIKKCGCENGYNTCETCGGTGKLVYTWFLHQKVSQCSHVKTWSPHDGLTGAFLNFDKLPWSVLFETRREDERLKVAIPPDATSYATKAMTSVEVLDVWSQFDVAANTSGEELQTKCGNDARLRASYEHAEFSQYDGIVRYVYRFEGKQYEAWINLATEAVEECENGLYASIAEDTVKFAQEAEQNGNPQDAIYYYCKADAISLKWGKENDTQKKRVKQYRMLGMWFGGAMLATAILSWLPGLIMAESNVVGVLLSVIGLIAITVCMVSLNEALQVLGLVLAFGLAYAAKNWFGADLGDDMVSREGYLLAFLFYALSVVTLTTDCAQRLPWGRKGLVIGGVVAGVAASPVALFAAVVSQSFVSVGGMLVPLFALLTLSVVRLPFRLKAGKMQKFVEKNLGKGDRIRMEIEKRRPSSSGLRGFLIIAVAIMLMSVSGIVIGGFFDACAGRLHFAIIQALQSCCVL